MTVPFDPNVCSFLSQKPPFSVTSQETIDDTAAPATSPNPQSSTSSSEKNVEIWIKNCGKPTAKDLEANEKFLHIVENMYDKLCDKHSKKKDLWKEIGKDMITAGFSFGERDPGTVCAQKWRNMESETIKVIRNGGPHSTGSGKINIPEYFNRVHRIIKDKAKANPKNLMDTLTAFDSNSATNNAAPSNLTASKQRSNEDVKEGDELKEEEEPQKPVSPSSSSPFLKVKSSSKPKKPKISGSDVLEYLKADSEKRDKQHNDLLTFLREKSEKEEEKKDKLLEILSKIADK